LTSQQFPEHGRSGARDITHMKNVNMNTAAGVNEQNVCKIHITETVCLVKRAMAPALEVP